MEKKIFDYSIDAEESTLKQFKECCDCDFVTSASLMPDAHLGYVAPIGSVLITKKYIVPAWVGYDIGCGVIAIKIKGKNLLEKIKKNIDKIYVQVNKKIPMGVGRYNSEKNISEKTKKQFNALLDKFEKTQHNKNIFNFLKSTALKHLGTLGSGNHFIEIGFYKKEVWLIIHSGSRGVGHRIAKKYMIKASNKKQGYEQTSPLDEKSKTGKEYLNILDFALDYALLNRLEISYKVVQVLEEVLKENLKATLWANKNHNHVILKKGKYIHRKGATPSNKNERGIIPGNMRDGSFLVKGKANPKFLSSSSHGAGRKMSRTLAKKEITLQQFKESMKGIKGTIVKEIIDESPMAYKDINKVMKAQEKSVKIIKQIKPLINWKGN